jgi:hypothetical protein
MKNKLEFELWSGTRCKKPFDDTMSELRLRQNISLCPLKNSYLSAKNRFEILLVVTYYMVV